MVRLLVFLSCVVFGMTIGGCVFLITNGNTGHTVTWGFVGFVLAIGLEWLKAKMDQKHDASFIGCGTPIPYEKRILDR